MPVIWPARQGLNWPEAAYAVWCPTCNVEIGKPCLTPTTHRSRAERAEAFGFVTVPAAPLLDGIPTRK